MFNKCKEGIGLWVQFLNYYADAILVESDEPVRRRL